MMSQVSDGSFQGCMRRMDGQWMQLEVNPKPEKQRGQNMEGNKATLDS